MSTPPIDPNEIPQEAKDGIVAATLGALAMAARLLLSAEPVSLGWVVRRVLAASLTALFVGYALQEYVASVPLRYAIIGACGYSAPEVADAAAKWLRAKMGQEVAKVTKPGKAGRKNGKSRK